MKNILQERAVLQHVPKARDEILHEFKGNSVKMNVHVYDLKRNTKWHFIVVLENISSRLSNLVNWFELIRKKTLLKFFLVMTDWNLHKM